MSKTAWIWKFLLPCRCGDFSLCYPAIVHALSLTGKRWIMRRNAPAASPSPSRLLRVLCEERTIEPLDAACELASFGMDANLFPDFAKVLDRITQAIRKKEHVALFGDYDCDGITATALMLRYFRRRGMEPLVRLPHRVRDGYGLKMPVVEELARAGVRLLVTLDTGISSAREIACTKAKGMDVIILDHHRMPPVLPDACAIIHPALADASAVHPSAAGIAWSVVRALEEAQGNGDWSGRETDIALGAMGTVADLVELRGVNRTLVHRGLRALGEISEGPLRFLQLQAGLQGIPTSQDIAFRLAPRINAAGRMADPLIALSALMGDHAALVQLEDLNRERQRLVAGLLEDSLPQVEDSPSPFLCMASPRFSAGICGLLAGKLTERFGKPSLVAHIQENLCIGSLRSIPGYNIMEALEHCSSLFLNFGGHAMAAGCSFAEDNLPQLSRQLTDHASAAIAADDLVPSLSIDMQLEASDLTLEVCEELRMLEPFGQGNPEPAFLIKNAMLERARTVGSDGSHLQASLGGKKVIGFRMGHLLDAARRPLDIVCHAAVDTWQGARGVQLLLKDMRVVQKAATAEQLNISHLRAN